MVGRKCRLIFPVLVAGQWVLHGPSGRDCCSKGRLVDLQVGPDRECGDGAEHLGESFLAFGSFGRLHFDPVEEVDLPGIEAFARRGRAGEVAISPSGGRDRRGGRGPIRAPQRLPDCRVGRCKKLPRARECSRQAPEALTPDWDGRLAVVVGHGGRLLGLTEDRGAELPVPVAPARVMRGPPWRSLLPWRRSRTGDPCCQL